MWLTLNGHILCPSIDRFLTPQIVSDGRIPSGASFLLQGREPDRALARRAAGGMEAARGFVLDEQGEADLLQEALRNVRDQAFRMKRAVDAGELHAVLKHAADVLRELRTSLLSPKNYYQLCACCGGGDAGALRSWRPY